MIAKEGKMYINNELVSNIDTWEMGEDLKPLELSGKLTGVYRGTCEAKINHRAIKKLFPKAGLTEIEFSDESGPVFSGKMKIDTRFLRLKVLICKIFKKHMSIKLRGFGSLEER